MLTHSKMKKLSKKLETEEFKDLLYEVDVSRLSRREKKEWKAERNRLLSLGYVVREKNNNKTTTYFAPNKKLVEGENKSLASTLLTSAAKSSVKLSYRAVKSVGNKVNPINKPINKNEVTDTGVESLRLANSAVKKTTSAVKTTKSAAVTAKNTAKTTAKVVQYSFKFVYEVAAQAVAIVINPMFLFFAAIVVIVVMLFGLFMLLIGGQNNSEEAMTTAEGLVEVADQYDKAKDFFNKALADRKHDFTGIVDSVYYNSSDLAHSHLVYVERVNDHHIFPKYFANGDNKNKIKNMWDYQIDEKDMIAIAYVWLEMKENTDRKTYLQIYDVKYDQDTFTDLVQKSALLPYTIIDGQECPDHNCQKSTELLRKANDAEEKRNRSADAFNEWYAHEYWHNSTWSINDWWNAYGWMYDRYPYYDNDGEDYGRYLGQKYNDFNRDAIAARDEYERSEVCEHHHRLHNIGLVFRTKDELMNELGFDETYKYWVELTVQGFEDNPDIP